MTCDLYQQHGAVFRWGADLTLKEQILWGSGVGFYMNYSCTCFLGEYGGPYSGTRAMAADETRSLKVAERQWCHRAPLCSFVPTDSRPIVNPPKGI